jgi:hypothetical protein
VAFTGEVGTIASSARVILAVDEIGVVISDIMILLLGLNSV